MFDSIILPNGLRVAGERIDSVRSCTVGVWVRVGSMNESPDENGLSHFIEHMVFKGTAKRTARDISEEMDMVGGQLNAFTGKDCTCFYAKVIDTDLRLAVDILSDLTLHPTFADAELQKERGVVLEEIAMAEDSPEDMVGELLATAQHSGSLAMPILGPAGQIRRYSRNDLLAYWKRHYTPANTVLAIAGHFDWEAFVALAREYFDAFPNAGGDPAPAAPQGFLSGRKAREKDTEQLHICLGFPGLPLDADDAYPLAVFNNALGGGMSSRLFQRIREELGMAYSVYTYPSSYPGNGTFNLYVGTTPENGHTVLKEIQSETDRLLRGGLTDKEFTSAVAQLRGGYVLGLESSAGRMQTLGRGTLLQDHVRTPEEVLAKIDAVTLDDVLRVGRAALSAVPAAAVVGKRASDYLADVSEAPYGQA